MHRKRPELLTEARKLLEKKMRRLIIDESTEDVAYVQHFAEQLDMLIGMVNEILVDNPQMLLSPVMRNLLSEKAKNVKSIWRPMKGRIHVDNPCQPLQAYRE